LQATVRSFDPATRSGSVFLDDGTVLAFGAAAFAASGLRLLRPGQRVAIDRAEDGAIAYLALATLPRHTSLPPRASHPSPGGP
jgi:hypothetical protein